MTDHVEFTNSASVLACSPIREHSYLRVDTIIPSIHTHIKKTPLLLLHQRQYTFKSSCQRICTTHELPPMHYVHHHHNPNAYKMTTATPITNNNNNKYTSNYLPSSPPKYVRPQYHHLLPTLLVGDSALLLPRHKVR